MIQILDFAFDETGQQHKARLEQPKRQGVSLAMMFYLSMSEVPLLRIMNKNTWPKNNM